MVEVLRVMVLLCGLGSAFSFASQNLACDSALARPTSESLPEGRPNDFPWANTVSQSLNRYQFFNYSAFSRLLFLGDGGKMKGLSQGRSDIMAVSSDLDCATSPDVVLNNNQLPFREGSFDLVLMNRGLCPCRGPLSCGGIAPSVAEMTHFLRDVVGVLDTRSSSMALLTGFNFPGQPQAALLWIEALHNVRAELGDIQVLLLTDPELPIFTRAKWHFVGFAVSRSQTTPIVDLVNSLRPGLAKP